MYDKEFCMSSYLAFRYIERKDADFFPGLKHLTVKLPEKEECVKIKDENDIDVELKRIFKSIENEKIGILLSGGMDSACLAAYAKEGTDAYTFRFLNGNFDTEELKRAEAFAKYYKLNLHYVDIDFDSIKSALPKVMANKQAPVHSIEPQLFLAAEQAKKDGVTMIVFGDAADYVFYGMDGLLSRDWLFEDYVKRATYIMPEKVMKHPSDYRYLYERYRQGDHIDFLKFYDEVITEESYLSYVNAFTAAGIKAIDPYEKMVLADPVDLARIRSGDSKYFIRRLFKMKYPTIPLPEKHPMPRPVDEYFKNWEGPKREEFLNNIDMSQFSGNQKWLLFCLEEFLNTYDK